MSEAIKPKTTNAKPQTNTWYSSWFDTPYYHILYKDRNYREAQLFMDNLTHYLNLPEKAKVLDLACGKGRHAIYLNQLGFDVVGADLSENSIAEASKNSNDTLHFVVHDKRVPYDEKFAGAYTPIDNRKIWCGNSDITPEGYNSIGSLSQCLQKGVGCGKRALAAKGAPPLSLAFLIPIILIILFNGGIFAFLYFYKPANVTSKGNNDVEIIDWSKFLSFYVPVACAVCFFIILMWNVFTNRRRR